MLQVDESMIGQKFGKLKVVKFDHAESQKHFWWCECDCGGKKTTYTSALRQSIVTSCGCMRGGKRIEMIGKRFGRLMVVSEYSREKHKETKWNCICDCGNSCIVGGCALRSGMTQSCGCLQKERARAGRMASKKGHGSTSRIRRVYRTMLSRCRNPKDVSYPNYGGRGIKVCTEWEESPLAFEEWAYKNGYDENAPRGQCTLDRIDTNGDYSPNNCRWLSAKEQGRNKRNTVMLTFGNETKPLVEWAEIRGLSPSLISQRLAAGWDIEKAISLEPSVHNPKKRKQRKVQCVETGIVYETAADAAMGLGKSPTALYKPLRDDKRRCGGYHWRYVD